MKLIVCGVDPGTGISSPTGFVAFDPETKELLYHANLRSKHKDFSHLIKDIGEQVTDGLLSIDPDIEVNVYIECFIMRGKAGEKLARLTGALMAAVPYQYPVDFVFNTTVKKVVAGHGGADKAQVAAGVYAWASENKDTKTQLDTLIAAGEWDVIDAFAIGLAGWLRKKETAAQADSKTAGQSLTTSK